MFQPKPDSALSPPIYGSTPWFTQIQGTLAWAEVVAEPIIEPAGMSSAVIAPIADEDTRQNDRTFS